MSGYQYDYRFSPARSTGWRSIVAGVVTVIAVVAVSATSGALVMLELIGSQSRDAETARVAATTAPSETTATIRNSITKTPIHVSAAPQPAARDAVLSAAATFVPPAADRKPHVAAAVASEAAPPVTATAPQAAEEAAEAKTATAVPEGDLTFTKGYAQRRVVQAAAEQAAARNSGAHVAANTQFGRAAVAVRRSTVARAYDTRRAAARGEHFDLRRDRALAYGEQYQYRRPYPQGGLFGNLFGGGNLF